MLEKTWDHLLLSGAALAVSICVGVPLGVVLGHLHRGSFVAVNVANVGRALPTLVVIAVGFTFLGLGFTNVMVALVVLAVPPILTNAYVAIDQVDPDAVEAARGMGMTPLQVLRRVEIPLGLTVVLRWHPHGRLFFVDRDREIARSRAAAVSATSWRNRRLIGSRASWPRRSGSRCSRSPPTPPIGLVQRWVTPAGLKQMFQRSNRMCAGRLTG